MAAPKRRNSFDSSVVNKNHKADGARALSTRTKSSTLRGSRVYDLKDLKSRGVRIRASQFRVGTGTIRQGTMIKASPELHREIQTQLKDK